MLISGFTIIRNGLKFGYPFLESIRSALPVCDEFIINIGVSDDSTEKAIQDFITSLSLTSPQDAQKIKTFESVWPLNDPEKRKGGQILAEQTNLALARCKAQWCLYLQADEVLHEQDLLVIRTELQGLCDHKEIEGLVFDYVHFYGTYDVIQTSRSSYRREVRVVRNGLGIQSVGDAQSFRHQDGSKLNATRIDAKVYHYGWVRPQEVMKAKTGFMDTLYHTEASSEVPATGDNYVYKKIVGLKPFPGTHPRVMQNRVMNSPKFDFEKAPHVFRFSDIWKIVSGWVERITDVRLFEYKNYRLKKAFKIQK